MALLTETSDSIQWYNLFKDIIIPTFNPIFTIIGTLWVGKLLGYFNKSLTDETNKTIKSDERIGELKKMITVQQITDIVTASETTILSLIKDQGDGLGYRIDKQGQELGARIDKQGQELGARIDKQGQELGARIDKLTGEIHNNSNRLLVLETKIEERIPKKPLIEV
ncbi:YggN family protein [Candidatus Gracilibacteria bacterium]|nr:YggN family protein [Candidatus Gracilibacteria bacterium]NJS40860.1 YggN family protein [Candidatus Gracilibacteria bacterium]